MVDLLARRDLAESTVPGGNRPLVIASGTGGLTPGQVRPNGMGVVPPRRTWEPACRPAGHRGADPRPSRPRRPLVRAAAPADGARRRRNEFMKAIADIARDNGVSGLPRARHPGIQHAHLRLTDWQPIRPG